MNWRSFAHLRWIFAKSVTRDKIKLPPNTIWYSFADDMIWVELRARRAVRWTDSIGDAIWRRGKLEMEAARSQAPVARELMWRGRRRFTAPKDTLCRPSRLFRWHLSAARSTRFGRGSLARQMHGRTWNKQEQGPLLLTAATGGVAAVEKDGHRMWFVVHCPLDRLVTLFGQWTT